VLLDICKQEGRKEGRKGRELIQQTTVLVQYGIAPISRGGIRVLVPLAKHRAEGNTGRTSCHTRTVPEYKCVRPSVRPPCSVRDLFIFLIIKKIIPSSSTTRVNLLFATIREFAQGDLGGKKTSYFLLTQKS